MKFNNTFMPNPIRRLPRANQAWSVDFMVLDFAHRPFVMLVVDVGTRRPLSATVSLKMVEDIIVRLERSVRRSGSPEQVWMDYCNAYNSPWGDFDPALRAWAGQRGISLAHDPLRTRSVAERGLRDLSAFLCDKHFPTLMDLGHDIERWRQSYVPATPKLPNVNQ